MENMQLKWRSLTGHQKATEVALDPTVTVQDIENIIAKIEKPFPAAYHAQCKITFKIEDNMRLLKLHAMVYGPMK